MKDACYRCYKRGHFAKNCVEAFNVSNGLDISSQDYNFYTLPEGKQYLKYIKEQFEQWKYEQMQQFKSRHQLILQTNRFANVLSDEFIDFDGFFMEAEQYKVILKSAWIELGTMEENIKILWEREMFMYESWQQVVFKYRKFGVY